MELPVINRFNGLESGITSLPNPTFLSQILANSLSGVETLSHSLDFWKWSAVIIAVVATFSGVVMNRVKILFVIFHRQKRVLQVLDDSDDEFSIDDDEEDTASSVSSSWSDFEQDDEPTTSSSFELTDRDFSVRGSDYYMNDHKTKQTLRLRHRRSFQAGEQFSWTDFSGGRSVVKFWENLRLEFDHCDSDEDEIRSQDLIKGQKMSSIFPAAASTVMLSAAADCSGKMSVNLWDTRVGFQIPALMAEWKPLFGKVDDVHFVGGRKVYVRDEDGGKITVGDVRNVKSPVGNLTAADVETWWDADAVMVPSE